jgi:hypothetical protein
VLANIRAAPPATGGRGFLADDGDAPASARLQAADRIVKPVLDRVGERLFVQKDERQEVTVHLGGERLADIVTQLRALGAIEGEATEE